VNVAGTSRRRTSTWYDADRPGRSESRPGLDGCLERLDYDMKDYINVRPKADEKRA